MCVCVNVVNSEMHSITFVIQLIVMPVQLTENIVPISYFSLARVKTPNVHGMLTCNNNVGIFQIR